MMNDEHCVGRERKGLHAFTLLEVLIVLVLFTVITAIVYATFSTVVNSTEMARVDVERLRLQEYLVRSFSTNLSTVFTDMLHEDANFDFIGVDYEDQDGPADSLAFCSTAALTGGFSLPGDLKLITYEIPVRDDDYFLTNDRPTVAADPAQDGLAVDEVVEPARKLVISETPLMTGNTESLHGAAEDEEGIFSEASRRGPTGSSEAAGSNTGFGEGGRRDSTEDRQRRLEGERRRQERNRPRPSDYLKDAPEDAAPITSKAMFQTPYFEVPVRTLDFEYFDGEEWVKEWNSSAYQPENPSGSTGLGRSSRTNRLPEALGRLPWAVRVRINFEKTEEDLALDKRDGIVEKEDVDFEMVIPVRQGQGITQHVQEVPELQNLLPGLAGLPGGGGLDGGPDGGPDGGGGGGGGGGVGSDGGRGGGGFGRGSGGGGFGTGFGTRPGSGGRSGMGGRR